MAEQNLKEVIRKWINSNRETNPLGDIMNDQNVGSILSKIFDIPKTEGNEKKQKPSNLGLKLGERNSFMGVLSDQEYVNFGNGNIIKPTFNGISGCFSLAGTPKEEIKIQIKSNLLTVSDEDSNYMYMVNLSRFDDLDFNNITTSYLDGVLNLFIPYISDKEINIKVN